MRIFILFFFIFGISLHLSAYSEITEFAKKHHFWADSILSKMTLEEKIGQLIMVTSVPSTGEKNEEKIQRWITRNHVGGILFLKTSPFELASSAQKYQSLANVPLFIAIDGENGLSFRMDSVIQYPVAMGLGSIANDTMLYQMGREVGQQCKMLGINLNFAPVADVNSNPENPIINYRSFGENPKNVAVKTWQFAHGMQDEHILVTAKHFPGHGDTGYDSHLTLPTSNKNYQELNDLEFIPFQYLIKQGINGVMSAHINLSKIDRSNRPATLSRKVITDILKDSLGFTGLVFSDGMNMKGITQSFSEAEAAVEAFKAGIDVIEFILDPEAVITGVLNAIKKEELSEKEINEKCRKVLIAKEWLGLKSRKKLDFQQIQKLLIQPQYELTSQLLFEQSITVIQNNDSILPLQRLDTLKIAALSIGDSVGTVFQNRLCDYKEVDQYCIGLDATEQEINSVLKKLRVYNLVIASIHGTKLSKGKKYNVNQVHLQVADKLLNQNKTILVFFSNPYALVPFIHLERAKSILITYGENEKSEDASAQLIFGAIGTQSKLPVSISEQYPVGNGIEIKNIGRLKYTIPEEVGFNSQKLMSRIDSFALWGIRESIFPGFQILVAKNGKVIVHKSYGYQTYDNLIPVDNQSMYDWASLTKITGPLPLLMKMTEDSILKLDQPFSNYWPEFKNTDKNLITLREILAHQAGFKSWVPFNKGNKKDSESYRKRMLSTRPAAKYPVRVCSNLYVNECYKCEMFADIAQLELDKRKKYFYSDIGFYLFPDLITELTGSNYSSLLENNFFRPLGADAVKYNPYQFYSMKKIVPTEFDDTFRKELIHGFVHDESAALLGGISGNAGLFGSANDMAKIMQFYLQKGKYGDFNYLKPSTIKEFTRNQYPQNGNRRGLGFDKPYFNNSGKNVMDAYPAPGVSTESFGHSGFTGTFVWADPKNQLLYIFLSNRVHPTRMNTKLTKYNYRPRLQQMIYDCQDTFRYVNY